MQALVARQELVNMIINQCHLDEGWNVRKQISVKCKQLIVFRVLILIVLVW
jgi:hypothetical protein